MGKSEGKTVYLGRFYDLEKAAEARRSWEADNSISHE